MTDKDIIKALEYCFTNDWNRTKCDKCAFYTGTTLCVEDLKSASLNLINHQQAEIERLRKEVNLVSIQFQDLQERYEEAQTEIKKLHKEIQITKDAYTMLQNKIDIIKSEAIKEFSERLKEKSGKMEMVCSGALVRRDYTISEEILDNLVKEMVGEE